MILKNVFLNCEYKWYFIPGLLQPCTVCIGCLQTVHHKMTWNINCLQWSSQLLLIIPNTELMFDTNKVDHAILTIFNLKSMYPAWIDRHNFAPNSSGLPSPPLLSPCSAPPQAEHCWWWVSISWRGWGWRGSTFRTSYWTFFASGSRRNWRTSTTSSLVRDSRVSS